MRDIKFRSWNKRLKCWGGGVSITRFGVAAPSLQRKDVRTRGDTYHIMQYTGLKDKNGQEIYEGDILKYKRDVGAVTYEGTEFVAISKKNLDWCNLLMPESEVVGNIYENPELLK